MYFTFEKKHQIDPERWITEANSHADFNAAMHRYHAVMDTHAYGYNVTLDYVGVSVETQDGRYIDLGSESIDYYRFILDSNWMNKLDE